MSTPTLIDLPPPPADPLTPSDMGPGTPNSGTTSLSALSTTAIKDGHQGHNLTHGRRGPASQGFASTSNMLDVERADRISRLAGLERVVAARPMQPSNLNPGSASSQPLEYFDNSPGAIKDRSTVGSASATESVGGRATWASGSIDLEGDKMSEDQDDGISSSGGMSDENMSLVGFGEAAGSTVSAPVSTPTLRARAAQYAAANNSALAHRSPSSTADGSRPVLEAGRTSDADDNTHDAESASSRVPSPTSQRPPSQPVCGPGDEH